MDRLENRDHHLITIYGDTDSGELNGLINSLTPEKDTRILTPKDEDALAQAAQSSSLILIALQNNNDPAIRLARSLKDNRMVVSDIVAVLLNDDGVDIYEIIAKGFDLCIPITKCKELAFKSIVKQSLKRGTDRLSRLIVEEQVRRFSDALSSAPTSVMVFDQDKRIVFVSEHYYRAYPKSARLLKRGLSVFDAFDLMINEEQIFSDDPRYEPLKEFWFSLSGKVEFTLDNGGTYRLRATTLPHERGTIVTAQSITEYVKQNKELQKALKKLKARES